MFTNWNKKANKETRLNPLSIDDIDALTIASLRGMGTTPERFSQNVQQDMPEDAMQQGEEIMRRNPKVTMPDSHFKLQGAQEQQMMDEMELDIPEFEFNEEEALKNIRMQEMHRELPIQRANEAYKRTYKDHVMQAFDKHKAFMQSLGNQPMTVQEFMQHPKVPSFTDYYNQAKEGTIPGGDYAEGNPFAITHPKEFIQHRDGTGDTLPPIGMEGLFGNNDPFIPVITGEPMDLAMDALLKQGRFENAAQRRIYSEIPSYEDYGLEIEDVPTKRIMPVENIESKGTPTFFKPIPLGGKRIGDPEPFEREKAMEGAKHILDLPDVKTVGGTWAYPLDLSSFAPEGRVGPDVNLGVGNNVTLGILDVPDWFAGQAEGRAQPEGYQIGGFDKDAYVRLDNSLGIPAIAPRGEWFDSARRISPSSNFPGRHDTKPRIGDNLTGYGYQPVYNLLSQFPVTTIDDLRDPISGYGPRNSDFLLEDWEDAKVASEPMDLAMDALLKNQPYHEMSKDQLDDILYGVSGYDAGTREYSRDETSSTQEEKDAAFNELLARQRETDANPVSVFGLNEEDKSRLVDFYEPQFTGRNISPDTFIPQTEEEGFEAYGEMERGELDAHIEDRLLDIDEFIPGKSFLTEEDPMGKYHHLRATAGDDVAANYLNRYRDFAMSNSQNPEYLHQQFMQMFDENQEVTAPQYTQEFPTDESIFNVKPPNMMMNEPDATGFAHNWQAKNASEPMDLAMDALLKSKDFDLSDIFDEKGNLKNYLPSFDPKGKPKQIETPPVHPGRTRMHFKEGKEVIWNPVTMQDEVKPWKHAWFPSQYNQKVNLPYDKERELTVDEAIQQMGILGRLSEQGEEGKNFARRYIESHPFEVFSHLNRTDSPDSPLQLNLQRLTEFKDYDDWDEFEQNDDMSGHVFDQPSFINVPWNEKTGFTRSEPMTLAIDALLKNLSPEAKRHKLEYDKKYESSPERVKYREELNRERRRRGIYGSGDHMDVSHTEGGKLTLESEHDNRARHFKDKGTLRPSD